MCRTDAFARRGHPIRRHRLKKKCKFVFYSISVLQSLTNSQNNQPNHVQKTLFINNIFLLLNLNFRAVIITWNYQYGD